MGQLGQAGWEISGGRGTFFCHCFFFWPAGWVKEGEWMNGGDSGRNLVPPGWKRKSYRVTRFLVSSGLGLERAGGYM